MADEARTSLSLAGGALEAGRPHIWLIDVTQPAFEALADRGLCSDADRRRADALRDASAQRRLLARRASLRIILGRYLDRDPSRIRVVVAPGGKPVVLPEREDASGGPIAFSVGHSGDLYCIAVAADRSVGVDVERLRTVSRAHSIASRWFGSDEARPLLELTGEELDLAFMQLWTGKEALAKRHGAGLRLMHGQSRSDEVHRALDVATERRARRLQAFEPGAGYLGAVATHEAVEGSEIIRPEAEAWTT